MEQTSPMEQIGFYNNYRTKLIDLLSLDLDFHDVESNYATHNFHSFPAKFPPQLPKKFIQSLTDPGDIILDPMAGSGTTVLEAILSDRYGIGFDIDPLAVKISLAKTQPIDLFKVYTLLEEIINRAKIQILEDRRKIEEDFEKEADFETKKFIDHWFASETQIELNVLANEISNIKNRAIRNFFEVALSSTIITKSGGVSLALDLAHTRPHRAKIVFAKNGDVLLNQEKSQNLTSRLLFLKKTLRPAIEEFQKRVHQNISSLNKMEFSENRFPILMADAQKLPLREKCIDLIVTSPPYASNAIDYMRAHKFSLVWFGYKVDNLSNIRKKYIGGEVVKESNLEELSDYTKSVINRLTKIDSKKGKVLHRYYSEMKRTLKEMFRVLKPQKAAIVVVGSSMMRGLDTEIHMCLAEIGQTLGFEVPKIGVRKLDRNRRMLPAGFTPNLNSQIQQRMHEEYVIGFYKPKN